MSKLYYVYILQCADGAYYTGITNNWELRLQQHAEGINPHCFTHKRRPVTLVHLSEFTEVQDALCREKQLKRWSRKKKEALIRKEYERLPWLARRQSIFQQ